jgi:hypothetical protein
MAPQPSNLKGRCVSRAGQVAATATNRKCLDVTVHAPLLARWRSRPVVGNFPCDTDVDVELAGAQLTRISQNH